MTASAARRARRNQQRRMAAMGVELVTRGHVQTDATVDVIAWEAGRVVKELALQGADMHASLAITVGEHPSFPGVITIEGKAAKKAPLPEIAVPPATEDDLGEHFRKTLGIESDDDDQTPCPAWIYIDGGNDTAGCGREKGHVGSHSCRGVPPWDDAAWLRAETMIDDD